MINEELKSPTLVEVQLAQRALVKELRNFNRININPRAKVLLNRAANVIEFYIGTYDDPKHRA